MIRFILCCILIFLFLIPFGLPFLLIVWIIGWFSPGLKERACLPCARWLFRRLLFLCGTKIRYEGLENLPAEGEPVLYVSNHRSYFDIIIGYPLTKGRLAFIAKKEFAKVPLMHAWMANLHCVFLDRSSPRAGLKSIQEAADGVKDGRSYWICPEGTRGHEEGLLPFKEGGFKIAERGGCPIIPVAFTHTDEIFELHQPKILPVEITVAIGAPIPTQGLSREEKKALHGQVTQAVADLYQKYV